MKVKELKLNPKNPRRISPDHLAKLASSITNFPKMMELRPIVYDPETMQVLGGNQRLQAIKNLKMTEIPDNWVKSAADLTPEEKKAFIIKDNVPLGEWDFEALEADFAEFDLEEMGIDAPEPETQQKEKKEKPYYEKNTLQLIPSDEYIIIKAPPNSEEFEDLKQTLKLQMVNRSGYSIDSVANVPGLERVLTWEDFKRRYNAFCSSK